MWSNIIAKIKSILDSNSLIQESYDYEEVNFKGQPAVVIVPSDNESNFTTNIDNERVYGVTVFLFVARGENYYKDKKCDEVMRNLVDSVIDDFDKEDSIFDVQACTVEVIANFFNIGRTKIIGFQIRLQFGKTRNLTVLKFVVEKDVHGRENRVGSDGSAGRSLSKVKTHGSKW